MASRRPASRFTSVDLPTLARPTTATRGPRPRTTAPRRADGLGGGGGEVVAWRPAVEPELAKRRAGQLEPDPPCELREPRGVHRLDAGRKRSCGECPVHQPGVDIRQPEPGRDRPR